MRLESPDAILVTGVLITEGRTRTKGFATRLMAFLNFLKNPTFYPLTGNRSHQFFFFMPTC